MNIALRISVFFQFLSFFSCALKDQERVPNADRMGSKMLDTAIGFSGQWVNEAYYNSLVQNKSPKLAQDDALFLAVPARTLQKTMMVYNFHEGGAPLEILKDRKTYELWEVNGDSLVKKYYDITVLSPDKIRLGDSVFVKVGSATDNRFVLENLLFTGAYTDENGQQISLESKGTVKGFGDFTTYTPVIDYYDAAMDVDQVFFESSAKKRLKYAFRFSRDTLKLYELACVDGDGSECYEVGFGKLKHTWIKE